MDHVVFLTYLRRCCVASDCKWSAIHKSVCVNRNLAILSLQDMVSSLSPWRTPSHVWMVLLERTGMVPSPDSILVRSCPRAFLFGCLSPWSETGVQAKTDTYSKRHILTQSNLHRGHTELVQPCFHSSALTLHSGFMRREDAGVSTGGGADVQVELDVFLQSEALSAVTPGKDGFVVLIFLVTGDTNMISSDITPFRMLQNYGTFLIGQQVAFKMFWSGFDMQETKSVLHDKTLFHWI